MNPKPTYEVSKPASQPLAFYYRCSKCSASLEADKTDLGDAI